MHVELEWGGGGGAVGRWRGGGLHHLLVCLFHLVLLKKKKLKLVKLNQPTFGLVILARFFPWLIELWAELLLKIVILFGAVS